MRCQTLYESLPCIYFRIDSAGVILSVSQFGAAYLGYRVEELTNHSSFSLIHPEDQEKQTDAIAKSINSKLVADCEYRVYSKDNKTLWVTARVRLIPDTDTNPEILLVWEDNTESYQTAAKALQQREQELEALAKLTESIATNLPGSVYRAVLHPDGKVSVPFASAGLQELTGIKPKEAMQEPKCLFPLIHPDDQAQFRQAARTAMQNLEPFDCEYRLITTSGQTKWVHDRARYCRMSNGDVIVDGVALDISDRKLAEAALRDSEYRYYTLAKMSPVGIFRTDAQGQCIYVNDRWCELAGVSWEESFGEGWVKALHPDDRKRVFTEWNRMRNENRPYKVECRFQHPDGAITWVLAQAIAEKGENAEVKGYVGTFTDITASKQAEKALRESREKYRLLFQIFPIGISITDEVGKIIEVNPASEKILGVLSEEHIQRNYDGEEWQIIRSDGKLMPPEEYPSVRALKENCLIENIEQGIVKPGNKISWISVTAAPIPLEGYGVAIAYFDITERKQTDEALRQQFLRERLMGAIQARIRQSLDLTKVLNTTVAEVRQFLQTDRVIIYRFEPNWSGIVIVESVGQEWTPTLGRKIQDDCFVKELCIEPYRQGRIQAVENIYTTDLTPCYVDLLAQFQVKANLVVPLLQGEKLWGLLVAQHCTQPRQWQLWEIELLKQLATQVGIAIQQAELYQQLEVANQELKRLATLDGLTGLANRRRFDEYIEQEWQRLAREQEPLSLILCDIDFFKLYNDTYGHQAGDDCLKQVATALRHSVKRPADLVARYGGEEFAVILPHTTAAGAFCLAKSIHQQIRQLKLAHPGSTVSQYVTLSLGVAGLIPCSGVTPAKLIAAADAALYEAKTTGRDRVILVEL
jgi:diguanylate cyclase (GGDEF)-like protein/PAS domain S-box-containing protein